MDSKIQKLKDLATYARLSESVFPESKLNSKPTIQPEKNPPQKQKLSLKKNRSGKKAATKAKKKKSSIKRDWMLYPKYWHFISAGGVSPR